MVARSIAGPGVVLSFLIAAIASIFSGELYIFYILHSLFPFSIFHHHSQNSHKKCGRSDQTEGLSGTENKFHFDFIFFRCMLCRIRCSSATHIRFSIYVFICISWWIRSVRYRMEYDFRVFNWYENLNFILIQIFNILDTWNFSRRIFEGYIVLYGWNFLIIIIIYSVVARFHALHIVLSNCLYLKFFSKLLMHIIKQDKKQSQAFKSYLLVTKIPWNTAKTNDFPMLLVNYSLPV